MDGDVFEELCAFVSLGPRFHGTSGEISAAEFLTRRLNEYGLHVRHQEVETIAWRTRGSPELMVTSPVERGIECWPMLWSGSASGVQEGVLVPLGRQGLWSNAMVWQKFAVVAGDTVVAYVSARDDGPAAPQPVPLGSDRDLPHLAIGHGDGVVLAGWLDAGEVVCVRLSVDTELGTTATGDNVYVDLEGRDSGLGRAIVCGHYDTFWNTPGAYDNGSGTVAVLELARCWLKYPPRRPVRLVFFAAEEWHLAGSRHYVKKMSEDERAATDFAINIDGLGRGNLLECSVGPESLEYEVVKSVRSFAESTGRTSLRLSTRFPPLVGTDDAAFYAAGIPGVHLTFNDFEILHRPEDLPNRDSASNIEWTISLARNIVDTIDVVERAPGFDLL